MRLLIFAFLITASVQSQAILAQAPTRFVNGSDGTCSGESPCHGTIQEAVLSIQACRDEGLGVLLEGAPAAVAAQVAMATSPDLLVCPRDWSAEAGIVALHDEMVRTMAWLTHQAS